MNKLILGVFAIGLAIIQGAQSAGETARPPAYTPTGETARPPAYTPTGETAGPPEYTPTVETAGPPAYTPTVETAGPPAYTPTGETAGPPPEFDNPFIPNEAIEPQCPMDTRSPCANKIADLIDHIIQFYNEFPFTCLGATSGAGTQNPFDQFDFEGYQNPFAPVAVPTGK